jgi:hypothetical protein
MELGRQGLVYKLQNPGWVRRCFDILLVQGVYSRESQEDQDD